ncbi:MAG: hypothetical protein JNL98_16215 [Bryobacterales bacterium]|nr:hypothetical protein [Bryobacterales bacterium]
MFFHFFRFELRFWLTSIMLYVFLVVIGLMIFGAASSDQIIVGSSLQNTYRNAPYVIQNFYAITGLLCTLMVVAFVNSAAGRDFQHNTHQILFSTPIRKRDYLLGRFWGSTIAATIPALGVSLGVIIAKWMPWIDAERWRSIDWMAHLNGVLVFALPNTIFVACLMFTVAALTRSTITSFVGGLLLLVGYSVAGILLEDMENEKIAVLLDPFGIGTFAVMTKYWTVAERNSRSVGWEGIMLWNRLLWLSVGAAVLAFGMWRFRMQEIFRKSKKQAIEEAAARPTVVALPQVSADHGASARLTQLLNHTRIEFLTLVKSTVFIVVVCAAMLNTLPSVILSASEGYGNQSLPVTYRVLDTIRGSLYLFMMALATHFGGVLVWKERDARCDEIHDALPYPNWIPFVAKFVSLMGALMIIQAVAMAIGIGTQSWYKYTRFQFDVYLTDLFVLDGLRFTWYTILAFFIHVISPNKYVGYFGFITFLIANAFIWRPLNVVTLMVRYASLPNYTYSDLFRYAPYAPSVSWFALYWALFSTLVAIGTVLLWPRGKETSLPRRIAAAASNFRGPLKILSLAVATVWIAVAGWVFYNTKVLNKVYASKELEQRSADYEKAYKKYAEKEQPRIQSVKYWIDVYPEQRNLTLRGEQVIENKSAKPLDEIHLTLSRSYQYEVDIERSRVHSDDTRLSYRIYKLEPPMPPGERRLVKYTVKGVTKGFENSVSNSSIVQNGTFFNNTIAPQIGYQVGRELSDRNDRRKYQLPEKDLMPALERDCKEKCRNTYLGRSSDWVSVESIMSTSPDQIAVAPGSLLREWTENGRRYFHYKLDRDSLDFYSFISARYEVAREDWNGVKVEVYYHKDHPWNVPKMVKSIRKSLEYCTTNFGPYAHRQARIIEFPRIASFAQAFPGTMPYSESIGFIANLKDDEDIDMVYYVVAHEMAHQWWAHQVIGAEMQGATLLSETMAQYSALMIMEKEYGRDMMRKFLSYEMDNYLRNRGREMLKERPLMRVEASQGYIHYRKGSVILYQLKEMIGEEAINRALRKMIQKFGYQGPPYPTSHDLIDALKEEIPADLHYLVADLFEDITLFSNRTLEAQAKKRPDGQYDVTIQVEARKLKSDEKGNEKEVAINDWIEIGAFAKPPKGKKYGATLHRERVRITKPANTFRFTVKDLPEKAGIDPFSLLVDRIPDDNLKKVTL